jgi:hypothetical protein
MRPECKGFVRRLVLLGSVMVGAMGLAGCSSAPPDSTGGAGGGYNKVGKPNNVSGPW